MHLMGYWVNPISAAFLLGALCLAGLVLLDNINEAEKEQTNEG